MSTTEHGEMARVEKALLARWPENRLEPSLTRIHALMDLLGSPQRAYPVVQVAGRAVSPDPVGASALPPDLMRNLSVPEGARTPIQYAEPEVIDTGGTATSFHAPATGAESGPSATARLA